MGERVPTSVDSYAAAAAFAIAGASARALMLSSIALHLAAIALSWSAIARRVDGGRAAMCVAPLVFASSPVETYVLYPPREASIAIAALAVWTLDRAADEASAKGARAIAIGGALVALACFADPYALVLAPPIAAMGVACALVAGDRAASVKRVASLAAGLAIGALPFAILRARAPAPGPVALTMDALARNAKLLAQPCLPWTIGATALAARGDAMTYATWDAPIAVRLVQIAGGALFVAGIVLGGACVFARRVPWPARRLAIAGALGLVVTIAGFLASPMVMDAFSSRYLVAIVVLAPLAFAPLAWRVGARATLAWVAPCAIACGVAGWVGRGPLGAPAANGEAEEASLVSTLATRGITRATADYWTAYRLTFLWREAVVVVPTNLAEDRYAPYRASFDAAPRVAYVFDPRRSREDAAWIDRQLAARAIPFTREESLAVGRFGVTILKREGAAGEAEASVGR